MSATAAPGQRAPEASGGPGPRRVAARITGMPRARQVAWAGVALGVIAAYITVPPITMRTPIVAVLLTLAALLCGAWAVRAGEKRHGWAAIVIGIAGGALAVVFTQSGTGNLEQVFVWSALVAFMLRSATPLVFGALGGVVSERSGVVNVGLEGMMLGGAFFAAWGADITGSWIGGLLVGMAGGAAFGLIHAIFAVMLKADQIVAGMGINFLALGVTGYLFVRIYGTEGTPDNLPAVPDIHLPIGWIPFIGDALEQTNLLVWIGLILVAVVSIVLFRTPTGLRTRSVGENPLAADTAGISVSRTRFTSVILSGVLASLGGAFLSIGFVHAFNENMTNGRGFIALAAVIFGKWAPGGALGASLLFGFSYALAQRLPAFSPSAATLFEALPYVLTLIAVAGLVGRSRPPAADGIPYER
jgi:general nucleoside transport system permease protein